MVALDKTSGAPVWAMSALDGEHAAYSSPILIRQGSREWLINCGSRHAFAVDAQRANWRGRSGISTRRTRSM
jgi:hypothetical protein